MTAATIITVQTTIAAPITHVWECWTTPTHITEWNAASPDWHTPHSTVDLQVGGTFSSRMEAKNGSFGFDFGGTYTTFILPQNSPIPSAMIARSASNLWPMAPKLPSLSNLKPNKQILSICNALAGKRFWTISRPILALPSQPNHNPKALIG